MVKPVQNEEEYDMGLFFLDVLQYLLIMIVLAVVAFAGAKIGIALRKKKDAKLEASESAETE